MNEQPRCSYDQLFPHPILQAWGRQVLRQQLVLRYRPPEVLRWRRWESSRQQLLLQAEPQVEQKVPRWPCRQRQVVVLRERAL